MGREGRDLNIGSELPYIITINMKPRYAMAIRFLDEEKNDEVDENNIENLLILKNRLLIIY